ncbi:neuronal acetylcholine receptor subunit alpha-7 [Elysia marginata]|uniref:Neuronal acetylcholine receptor subunit alpha-7 n=1 Tax=Elysia marginata TaxID=1093978 RepID=A0AAV4ICN7_9GAST|nr:neuronal acetylcholine receptor subunit alpha-7 [Elysia marginata]
MSLIINFRWCVYCCSADLRLEEHRDALCIINSTGFVYHVPQVVYKSSCPIDVYVFPFDIQNCTLKFGSWAYNGKELDLQFYDQKEWIDLTAYLESSSWTIVDCPAFRHVTDYSCCPDSPWVDMQYHLIFQRRSTLYNYILILPCILLTSITLILFFIPPESPAKMQLGTYYCLNMILITLSSFLNVLIVDLTTHGLRTASPPRFSKFFFSYLAKCLLMEDLVRPFKSVPSKSRCPKDGNLGRLEDNKWKHESGGSNEAIVQMQREQISECDGVLKEIELKLTELRDFMRVQKMRLLERDQRESIARQWKAVALLLDRIFFIVYLVVIVASLSYTLPTLTSVRSQYQSTVLDKARGLL